MIISLILTLVILAYAAYKAVNSILATTTISIGPPPFTETHWDKPAHILTLLHTNTIHSILP